eukprot:CAMPEP_0198680164 /NCGR_PEP_ID=MMETSP1468-20131203/4161_1 /TAXON_ID=1461545 /ORGANISM="Mantoniella sp, Strain CCMP1436" /LENGTH=63 /DNA_ID=CAMNT_0044419945 /DNA_START=126 /DNA_END=314 /DNA_ORIENTATION=+
MIDKVASEDASEDAKRGCQARMRRDVPAQGATVVSGCTRDWTVFPVQARDWPEHRVGTGLGIA